MTDCTYCGCRVETHDPIAVVRPVDGFEETEREGVFCNYGCLSAHIEAAGLAVGTTCEWSPDG